MSKKKIVCPNCGNEAPLRLDQYRLVVIGPNGKTTGEEFYLPLPTCEDCGLMLATKDDIKKTTEILSNPGLAKLNPVTERMKRTLTELAHVLNDIAARHGWWDTERNPAEVIALIHSELSEALEEYRLGSDLRAIYPDEHGKPCGFTVELADALIRLLDYCAWANLPLADALAEKAAYNERRPYRHGNKIL